MKIRLGLSIRLVLLIIVSAIIIYNGTIKVIGIYYEKIAFAETMASNDNQALEFATIIKTSIEKDLNKIRSYAYLLENQAANDFNEKQNFFNETLNDIVEDDPSYISARNSLELSFTDENWEKTHGRVCNSYHKGNYGIEYQTDSLDLEDDDYESQYFFLKIVPEETLTNPTWYSRTGKNSDKKLQTSLMVPLSYNDKFIGIASLTIDLKRIQNIVDSLSKESSFDVSVFSFNGDIIHHPNKKSLGQNIVEVDTFLSSRFKILDRIQSNENSNFIIQDRHGKDSSYFSIASFKIGNTHTPWALLITAPLVTIESKISQTLDFVSVLGYFGLSILTLVILAFSINMVRPLKITTKILRKLAKGEVHDVEPAAVKTSDEIGEISSSVNSLITRLNHITSFAEEIGKGNFNSQIELSGENDLLGKSVIEMRNSLETARNEELNRITEKDNLNWASEGINLFNKILRVDNQNLERLNYDIIKNITTYMGAHMGGIYLQSNTDDNQYELTSFIGFNKAKFNKKTIIGDESEVGRCILEKETIFMDDIPDHYASISSGLGSSKPVSILIVPLIHNDILVGILELESLKTIQKHQIDFVEKLAETIASTVSSVKINVRTSNLLSNSQKQAEELEQQEEEMRQNMEEMQATQEEAKKQEDELVTLIEGYNKILLIAEYDSREKLININDNYLKIFKIAKSQIIGKQHKADLFMDEQEKVKHQEFWKLLLKGEMQESFEYIKSGKEDYWILEKFIPLKDRYGSISKILCVGFDITKQKKIDSQLKQIQEGNFTKPSNKTKTDKPSIDLKQELTQIDLTYLKMVYKKDPQKIYNILKLYYDTLPPQVLELKEINDERDFKKLKSKINSLKTKMSYLGLKKIYEELRKIERIIAEDTNLIDIPNILETIFQIWTDASKELEMLLKIPRS